MDPPQTTTMPASIRVCMCEWLCVCNYIHKQCVCMFVRHCALVDQTILSLWLLFFCHKYLLDIWVRAKLEANLWRKRGVEKDEGERVSCQANLSAVLWKFNTIPCGATHMRLIHIKLMRCESQIARSLWYGGQAIKGNILIPHLYWGKFT